MRQNCVITEDSLHRKEGRNLGLPQEGAGLLAKPGENGDRIDTERLIWVPKDKAKFEDALRDLGFVGVRPFRSRPCPVSCELGTNSASSDLSSGQPTSSKAKRRTPSCNVPWPRESHAWVCTGNASNARSIDAFLVGYPARSVMHRAIWPRSTWLKAGFRNA